LSDPLPVIRPSSRTFTSHFKEDAMSVTMLNPCLIFDGTADKAIKLYEKALGARTERIMRAGDMPDQNVPAGSKDRIVHAALRVGERVLMLMDGRTGQPVAKETNVLVSIEFNDLREMTTSFETLADGGQVTVPLHDAVWGAKFGMVTDRHGIRWMFSCETKS
jgi:PhnB protein